MTALTANRRPGFDPVVERARCGAQDAVERLWKDHESRAYGYALRLCKVPDLASDLVSESFMRAIDALPSYRGACEFGLWLNSIIRNCYLDRYRRMNRFPNLYLSAISDGGESVLAELQAEGPGPEEICSRGADRRLIEEAVAKLAPEQRACIDLYYFESMGVEDIAACMGVPAGTVKTRLHRARHHLRQSLWQFGEANV